MIFFLCIIRFTPIKENEITITLNQGGKKVAFLFLLSIGNMEGHSRSFLITITDILDQSFHHKGYDSTTHNDLHYHNFIVNVTYTRVIPLFLSRGFQY